MEERRKMNIEEVFPGGKYQPNGEYVIRCIQCGDSPTHNHLYINEEKGVFYCFYCGYSGKLEKLLKEHSTDPGLKPRPMITEKEKRSPIDFSLLPKVTKESNWVAFSYLKKRGLTDNEIEMYDIRYADKGKYECRVIVPIYEEGQVVCFSARDFVGLRKKYLFPAYGETLLTAGEAIFNLNRAKEINPHWVIVSEGVFDAIHLDRILGTVGLSILSNELARGQLKKLLRLPNHTVFIIMLDSDAHKKSMKMARKLYECGRTVYVSLLDEGDPASLSQSDLDKAISYAQRFSLELETKTRLEIEE